MAEADAFHTLKLRRHEAVWAIRALRDTALPLFAAAGAREGGIAPEIVEPAAMLKPAPAGREVVDDYDATGFSLKAHPLAFLRAVLSRRSVTPAADLAALRDGQRVRVAGLVLVRQRPGSAKGVMFVTLEDESGPLNVIVWPNLFERFRRVVFSAAMLGVEGKLQREGDVIHVIADRLVDLSAVLRKVGERNATFPLPHGRGDEARSGGIDGRGAERSLPGVAPRDIYIPDLRLGSGTKVKTRDFR